MSRRAYGLVLVALVAAVFPLLARAQTAAGAVPSSTVQVRQTAPPPLQATAGELESRADELRETKLFIDAIDYYQAALKKANNATLQNKLGICYLQLQRWEQAKKAFERAIKLDKELPEAHNNLGVVQYSRKKYKDAIKQYQKALELREDSASFHSNLGTAYFARKEYVKANNEYIRALEIDPEIFERRSTGGVSAHLTSPEERAFYDYVIAKTYAKKGDYERSLLYLRKAMEDGYAKIDNVYKDDEFALLRKDPRFTELMAARPAPIPN